MAKTDVESGPSVVSRRGTTSGGRGGITPVGGQSRAHASGDRERSKRHAAVWIRVLLRLRSGMPLADLARELGFSDRDFGSGLGLLIRQGKATIRRAPGDVRVVLVENGSHGASRMPEERR